MTAISPVSEETPRQGRFLLAMAFSVLGVLSFGGAWLAPNHYGPWAAFHGEAAGFAALVAFAAGRLAWPQAVIHTRAFRLVSAILLVICAQWWTGQIAYGGDAFVSGLYIVGCGFAWWLGANSTDLRLGTHPALWLAWIVVGAAGLSVAITLLQWLRMETWLGIFAADRAYDVRPYGNLGQPNHLASLMLMAMVLTLLLHARGRIGAVTSVVLVAWFSLGLTLTESRSGLLSAFAVGALVLFKRRAAPQLPPARWIAGWWTLLAAVAFAWPTVNSAMLLDTPRGALALRDNARQVIWKQCLAGIQESPWVGYGWRQSMVGQKAGAHSVSGWQMSDYAHNIALDLMLWVGVPLALLLGAWVLWWSLRVFMRSQGAVEVLLLGAVVPILVHSMFEFPFAYSYFLFPVVFALGMFAQMQNARAESDVAAPAHIRPGLIAATILAVFAMATLAVAREYIKAEEDYRVMRFELSRVGRTPEGYQSPRLFFLTQLDEMLKAGRIVPRPDMPVAEIDRLRGASLQFGWASIELRYAIALALNGDTGRAERELHLLHASYGDEAYAQALTIWRSALAQYPQLAAVSLP